ncbi:glycerol-3-phosphate dehydrogenase/oxidase [Flavobacteriaceae bacterium F08102]|nr:glycerol-3-phosphate dehydrogenase/oxidase [Flavobacteriaceae bacterium F08102]
MRSREELLKEIANTKHWDVIVIGGGASGLGIAVDSVTRGYKTVLLEQLDFAKGTSSRSTKLVHGGVRYLAQGNVDLVKEALYERGLLFRNAPHLVHNQSFIIPNYSWWDSLFYTVGLKLYDFLAGKLSLGKSSRISREYTLRRLTTLKENHLKGGVVYFDGQFDDARLALNLAQTGIEKGATILNYCKVTGLRKGLDGKVNGVEVIDCETRQSYQLKGTVVINATGVFTDEILQMDNVNAKPMVRPSQGIHLVVDRCFLPGDDAVMIPHTSDGRILFLVPWHDKVIIGTTDTLLDSHSIEPKPLDKEVEFILNTANLYLSRPLKKTDVLSVYAGLRPLAAPKNPSAKTKEISRSHKVIVSASNLITITGGKWTTYRRMAQDTLNKAILVGKLPAVKCVTKSLAIHGATPTVDRKNHLYIYGTDVVGIEQLIGSQPWLGEKIHPQLPFLKAEVVWAVKFEMARTVEDVLARRVRMLFLNAKAASESAPFVAKILGDELGKGEAWQAEQLDQFRALAAQYQLH